MAGSTDFAGLRHSANVTHAMTRDTQGTLPHQLGQLVSMLIILWQRSQLAHLSVHAGLKNKHLEGNSWECEAILKSAHSFHDP